MPNIAGKWYSEIKIKHTAYIPFQDMVLRYVIMIWREGNIIKGTAEKIYEDSSTEKEKEIVGKDRTRANLEGYIEKNYLGRDKVYIHFIESGHLRESTAFYKLSFKSNERMEGHFDSMAADQKGEVTCQRDKF